MTETQREAYQALQASLDTRDNGGEKAHETGPRPGATAPAPRPAAPAERA